MAAELNLDDPDLPGESPESILECKLCDKTVLPATEFCEDHQPTETSKKCKACKQTALPLSLYCEDHQDKILHVVKKVRLRPRDFVVLLGVGALLWAGPKVDTPAWKSVTSDGPGIWASIKGLAARMAGRDASLATAAGPGTASNLPADDFELAAIGDLGSPAAADSTRASHRALCGNGVVERGEQCDGDTLGGASCMSLGFAGDCGADAGCIHASLACLANCRFDFSGCTAQSQAAVQRFVSNGNGTATDRLTGLVWELKCAVTGCQEYNAVVGKQTWQSAVTAWVSDLNAHQFAGHDDWRLPSLEELRTLLVALPPCANPPCPVAAWPRDETAPAGYWSSTSFSLDRDRAWAVSFADGEVYTAAKGTPLYVRAVRNGS